MSFPPYPQFILSYTLLKSELGQGRRKVYLYLYTITFCHTNMYFPLNTPGGHIFGLLYSKLFNQLFIDIFRCIFHLMFAPIHLAGDNMGCFLVLNFDNFLCFSFLQRPWQGKVYRRVHSAFHASEARKVG